MEAFFVEDMVSKIGREGLKLSINPVFFKTVKMLEEAQNLLGSEEYERQINEILRKSEFQEKNPEILNLSYEEQIEYYLKVDERIKDNIEKYGIFLDDWYPSPSWLKLSDEEKKEKLDLELEAYFKSQSISEDE